MNIIDLKKKTDRENVLCFDEQVKNKHGKYAAH